MNETPETTIQPIATSEVETLGVKAVSKSLGVSRATVLRWIGAGKIEGFFRIVFLASPPELREIYSLVADFTAEYLR